MTENTQIPVLAEGYKAVTARFAAMNGEQLNESQKEKALSARFSRAPRRTKEELAKEELVYEFTRDPALLHQYYGIYQRECRVINHVLGFREAENEYNDKSHILIARIGNLCVGGARLTVSTPRKPQKLPVEINGFKLKEHFPHLEQKEMCYGELSRLVLLPEFRTGDIARQMFWHLYRKAVAVGMDIGFAAAPLVNIRAYKLNFMALGLKQSDIHYDIDVPAYPGFEEVKDYLLSLVVDKSLVTQRELNDAKDVQKELM